MELPPLDVPPVDAASALGAEFTRDTIEGFPEVSEIEVIRHFTRLSTWNYAIDLGMYPLGSCTMKYNPRVNEYVARLDGLASEHPNAARRSVARLPAHSPRFAEVPARHYGNGRSHFAARGRRARRADRPADDSRVSRKPGQRAKESSDSGFRARHESRVGGDRRLRSAKHQVRTSAGRSIPTICASSARTTSRH